MGSCTDLYYARGAQAVLPMRVGCATSNLDLYIDNYSSMKNNKVSCIIAFMNSFVVHFVSFEPITNQTWQCILSIGLEHTLNWFKSRIDHVFRDVN